MKVTKKYLEINKDEYLAYHQTSGNGPGVVFIHGLMSDMEGAKALSLEAFCKKRKQAFLRFDCRGHGQSSGQFTDGTIGQWASDLELALKKLTKGPQILVGSSMGGWLMLLMALRHPKRVKALIGIAAAPDFTERIWEKATPAIRKTLVKTGVYHRPSKYSGSMPITHQLIVEGKKHFVLKKPMKLKCPLHLIQGMKDESVPWQLTLKIAEQTANPDVIIKLIKDGDHRLSRDTDIDYIKESIIAFSF